MDSKQSQANVGRAQFVIIERVLDKARIGKPIRVTSESQQRRSNAEIIRDFTRNGLKRVNNYYKIRCDVEANGGWDNHRIVREWEAK